MRAKFLIPTAVALGFGILFELVLVPAYASLWRGDGGGSRGGAWQGAVAGMVRPG